MYTEQEKCARYIVACINEFALQKKLDRRASFRYLYNHKGSVNNHPLSWQRELNSADGRTTVTHAREMTQLSSEYSKAVMGRSFFNLFDVFLPK